MTATKASLAAVHHDKRPVAKGGETARHIKDAIEPRELVTEARHARLHPGQE